VAFLCAGPLADRIFEPLLAARGALASSVGALIGVGTGRGIGLLYAILAGIMALIVMVALRSAPLRRLDDEIQKANKDRGP
jgi:hypothetical protein